MEKTLDEALNKIFGGLMGKEKGEVSARPEFPSASITGGKDVVLSQSDYTKIKQIFERVMGSQTQLDRSLANYKKDLQSLGKVLEKAEAGKQEVGKTP
jgi:uncharacterized membrane protein (UPF0182 family)